nr:hypothetical protein [Tanacetum cinerariifolium]
MASEHSSLELTLYEMTHATISSGLVPNPPPSTPFVPPLRTDWDLLFQPLFDELLNPLPSVDHSAPEVTAPIAKVVAPELAALTGSPSLTTVDQDAPSPSNSQTTPETQITKTLTFRDDPLHESLHEDSNFQGSSLNIRQTHTPFESLGRWSKDHPIANVIGDPFRSVSTRKQLQTNAMWCFFDAFLTTVEPKNFKQAMIEASWIDAMQEEIHQYKRTTHRMCTSLKRLSMVSNKHHVHGNDLLLVQIYVDDIIFASTNTAMCNEFANSMTTKFKMSMMGKMSLFLGLQIFQSLRGIFINQSKYAYEIVKKYGMLSSDSVDVPLVEKSKLDEYLQGKLVDATLYRGMIGSLMYLTSSRPDLTYAVCLCARYQAKPIEKHLNAEHIALFGYCARILWMWSQLTDYGLQFNKIPLYCDNKSVIALCCNSVQYSGAKHINVRYHFIKEQMENGIVELYFVRTEYQLAGIFTKPLPRERFNFLIEKLSIKSMSPDTLKRLAEETNE